jgi:hypothetical protein
MIYEKFIMTLRNKLSHKHHFQGVICTCTCSSEEAIDFNTSSDIKEKYTVIPKICEY